MCVCLVAAMLALSIKRCIGLATSVDTDMAKRLVEQYKINEVVEINMRDGVWITAVVIRHQHPGIWVQTVHRSQWFVTNTTRIRPYISGQAKE